MFPLMKQNPATFRMGVDLVFHAHHFQTYLPLEMKYDHDNCWLQKDVLVFNHTRYQVKAYDANKKHWYCMDNFTNDLFINYHPPVLTKVFGMKGVQSDDSAIFCLSL